MNNKCRNCKFFAADNKPQSLEEHEGECRFNPPDTHIVVIPVRTIQGDAMNAQAMSVFPRMLSNKFCGKFEPELNS